MLYPCSCSLLDTRAYSTALRPPSAAAPIPGLFPRIRIRKSLPEILFKSHNTTRSRHRLIATERRKRLPKRDLQFTAFPRSLLHDEVKQFALLCGGLAHEQLCGLVCQTREINH